jgi:hypothetical protein
VTHSRRRARQAGTRFESSIAIALAEALDDDRVERRSRNGAKDRGDIAGVRLNGQRVVIECKDVATLALPKWTTEARTEAGNDGALVGVVVHKRRGITDTMQQWVSMTLADLVAILTGRAGRPMTALTYENLVAAIGTAPSLPGARCKNRGHLFDPAAPNEDPDTTSARHAQALGLCSHCPALERCGEWFDGLKPSKRPVGVVAGRINQPTRRGRPREAVS